MRNTESDLRFAPLICVCVVLLAGAMLYYGLAPEAWGVSRDTSLVLSLVYVELSLAPLLPVRAGRGPGILAANLAGALSCWAAASACVLLFGFATSAPLGLRTRALSLGAWLCASGLLAAGAAIHPRGAGVARPLLIATFALPPLADYLSREYALLAQGNLAAFSPHWSLALGETGMSWQLALLGAGSCVVAALFCFWKRRPA